MNVRKSLPVERRGCKKAWKREEERLAIYSLERGGGLGRIVGQGGAQSTER